MEHQDYPKNPKAYILFSEKIKMFYQQEAQRLARLRLKPSQARLLHFLSDYEGLNQQEASAAYGIGSSTMSELLSALEQEGYIWREINQENKRMVFIHLTEKGTGTADHIHQLFDEYCTSFMRGFTEEESAIFESLLVRFAR